MVRYGAVTALLIVGAALAVRLLIINTPLPPTLVLQGRITTPGGYATQLMIRDGIGRPMASPINVYTRVPPGFRPFLAMGKPLQPASSSQTQYQEVYVLYPSQLTYFDSTRVRRDTVVFSVDTSTNEFWIDGDGRHSLPSAFELNLANVSNRLTATASP